jgi:hypothetical protein
MWADGFDEAGIAERFREAIAASEASPAAIIIAWKEFVAVRIEPIELIVIRDGGNYFLLLRGPSSTLVVR